MIIRAIDKCLKQAGNKRWPKTYWAFDIHGTILKPTFNKGEISTEFYPFAKEALQAISQRADVVRILFTCSYPEEIKAYIKLFDSHGIHFDYVNENPEVVAGAYGYYAHKFYFNVLFEDKAGFDPMMDWKDVRDFVIALTKEENSNNN